MGVRVEAAILGLAIGLAAASASAMSAPGQGSASNCRLVGADKLPKASGGGTALCAAIDRAVHEGAPGVRFSVDVSAQSASMLSAAITVNGQKLPDQKFAAMDRKLTSESFERFARAVARVIADAAK